MERGPPCEKTGGQCALRSCIASSGRRHQFDHNGCRDCGRQRIANQAFDNRKGYERVRRHTASTARDEFLSRVKGVEVGTKTLTDPASHRRTEIRKIYHRITDVEVRCIPNLERSVGCDWILG